MNGTITALEASPFECEPCWLAGLTFERNCVFDVKEYTRTWQRDRWRRLRAEYLADKFCVRCGSTRELEIDHIDPSTKTTSKFWMMGRARREAELAKCQVLCKPCHIKKTHLEDGQIYKREWGLRQHRGTAQSRERRQQHIASFLATVTDKEKLLKCKVSTSEGTTTLFHIFSSIGRVSYN